MVKAKAKGMKWPMTMRGFAVVRHEGPWLAGWLAGYHALPERLGEGALREREKKRRPKGPKTQASREVAALSFYACVCAILSGPAGFQIENVRNQSWVAILKQAQKHSLMLLQGSTCFFLAFFLDFSKFQTAARCKVRCVCWMLPFFFVSQVFVCACVPNQGQGKLKGQRKCVCMCAGACVFFPQGWSCAEMKDSPHLPHSYPLTCVSRKRLSSSYRHHHRHHPRPLPTYTSGTRAIRQVAFPTSRPASSRILLPPTHPAL